MENLFYKTIREHYDHIFPLNQAQVDFVNSYFSDSGSDLIEVGSATGQLTDALSSHGIIGIDLEQSFVDIAKVRYQNIPFVRLNMLDIDTLNRVFDGVICFGNTLVHITDRQILEFLTKTFSVIKPGGKLLLQIINYDHIINNRVGGLPTIDNDHIRFKRIYLHGDKFIFKTELYLKDKDLQIGNEIELTPIGSVKLIEYLRLVGFENLELFGNFKKGRLENNSIPLIIAASKPS